MRKFSVPSVALLRMLSQIGNKKSETVPTIPRTPIQPIEPVPLNPKLDYFNHIFSFLENMREMENDLKKRTYGYGLMIVGRPLQELSFGQKLLRAALMPNKYYEDATSYFITRLHNMVNQTTINRPTKTPELTSLTQPIRSSIWGRLLRRFLSNSLSTPLPAKVMKHREDIDERD